MADRRVNVKLDGDSRSYVNAAEKAADATDRLQRKIDEARAKLAELNRAKADPKLELEMESFRKQAIEAQNALNRLRAQEASPELDLEIAKFEAKLERAQQKLRNLGDAKSELNLAASKAQADLTALERQLAGFSGKKYSANVGVNGAAKAAAEIADLRARLQKVEGRYTATMNMNMQGAQRDVALIMNSLFALGPAAVTSAAVAGGAIVALGSTIATVAAGIGVSILAFNGVGEALKAMGDADAAAGKNAIKGAQDRTTATRAIESARTSVVKAEQDQARAAQQGERDISDAKAKVTKAATDAAWANTKAAADVGKAEDDLAASHQKVRYALEELSFARSQAVRDLEDMKEATSDYALREEAAQIRLVEAREKLRTLDLDAGSTAHMYRKARLEVAEAEDAVSDAQRDGARARIDLNSVEANGIEGMGNVVKARRNVQEAEAGLAASKADLIAAQAEETRTTQEGQAKIAAAVRDLADTRDTAAQRNTDAAVAVQESQARLEQAVADASTKMGEQSTEAQKLAKEMGQLAPAGQAFAQYLYDLKPKLKELQELSQAGLFPGVEDGIDSLMLIFPDVAYMVDQMAKGLGDMARQAGDALNDPFWREFVRFLGDEAGPTFESFFKIGESVARGLAGVQMAFNPMARDLIGGLEDMADRFAKWGTSLEGSQGFQKFIAYVEENGPDVVATLGSIASMIGNIAEAAAPLGPVVLTVIKALADTLGFIASIPGVGTTLLAVGAAMGALSLALRGIEIAKFSNVGKFLGAMPGHMGKAGDAAGLFALRMGASGEAAQSVADKTSRAARGIETAGKFALGAVAGVAVFTIAMDALSASSDDAVTALGQGGAAADQMRRRLEEQNPSLSENSAWWEKLNHNVNSWVYSLLGIGQGVDEAEADLAKQREGMNGVQRATSYATEAQGNYEAAVARFGNNSWQAIAAGENLRAKTREVELQQIMAAEGVDRMTAAVYAQNDAMAAAVNADMAAERAQLTFDQTVVRATETLRTHTASSLEGRDATMSVREAAVRAAEAAGEKARKDAEATGASDGASRAAAAQRDKYLELAAKVEEPLRSQLKLLADDIVALPPIKDIKVRATGEWSAGTYVMDGKAGGGARNSAGGTFQNPGTRYATGGYVRGPGTTTSDDINARLSDKEYVVKASATQSLGVGTLDYINRTGQLPAFAEGGLFEAGQPGFSTMVRPLEHELTSRIAKQMADSMMSGGGNGLAWAQSQAGKPYLWGAVGPSAYDCSGFMAAIMNVMDGVNPYRRRGTTATFPWPGMEPGMGPGLSVGNTRNAGGGVGHMAGTINGVNVESRGGDGVVVGPRARGAQDRLFNSIYHYVGRGNFPGGSSAVEGGQGLARWADTVRQALARVGQPQSLVDTTLRRMNQESSGNPRAINNWDSNARRGTPSKGLMQVIDPTFAAYRDPGLVNDIWDPMANIVASMRYAMRRYGSLPAAYNKAGGYSEGGRIAGIGGRDTVPGWMTPGERVLTVSQNQAFEQLVDVLARPRPVSYVPSPGAGGAGGSSRSVTIKNENHFRETVDLDLFNARQEFAISSASF